MSMPSVWEWGVIILLVVLIFGAKRLPELGSSLGKGIRNFKKTVSGESDKEIENKKSS